MRAGRVVLLSDYAGGDSSATGGAGHVVLDTLAALRAYGVDVALIHGFGASLSAGASSLGGADLRDAGIIGAARSIYNLSSRKALRKALQHEDRSSTIIIVHQWTRYLSPSAIGIASDFPMMVHLHDHFWACPNGAYYDFPRATPCDRRPLGLECLSAQCDRNGRLAKFGRLARHYALALNAGGRRETRLLLHLSHRAKHVIAPLLPYDRHAVLQNPLDIDEVPPEPPVEPRYDVGYFGRLEPEKGLLPLLDALSATGQSALMVGNGSLAGEIARHPQVELQRWKPRAAMAAAMRTCRVIILPSLWPETWGLIVPEAMAAGVPVLVSERAGSAELVEKFGGGAIFDPTTPGGLQNALEMLLDRPPETPVRDWSGFRSALSADRHAARIVQLAGELFDIDLTPKQVRGSAAARAPAPRRRRAM